MTPADDASSLCCPISLELFVDPVQTPCCGNTLSRSSLKEALPRCPLCRVEIDEAHPAFKIDDVPTNRTVARLVDEHLEAKVKAVAEAAGVTTKKTKEENDVVDLTDIDGDGGPVYTYSQDEPPVVDVKTCGACGATGPRFRCTKCKSVHYCSAACQHSAWPDHKKVCREIERHNKRGEELAKRHEEIAKRQLDASGGGLACTREPSFAADHGIKSSRGFLMARIIEGMHAGKLVVLTDFKRYDRLLLASKQAGGKADSAYNEHVVEAGLLLPQKKEAGKENEEGGEKPGEPPRCWWTMMDWSVDVLKAQNLSPIDAPTLHRFFNGALDVFDAAMQAAEEEEEGAEVARKMGGSTASSTHAKRYGIRADPTIGDAEGDAVQLVEQMLYESTLKFLLPKASQERFGSKKPIDPKDVRKALEMFGGAATFMPRDKVNMNKI